MLLHREHSHAQHTRHQSLKRHPLQRESDQSLYHGACGRRPMPPGAMSERQSLYTIGAKRDGTHFFAHCRIAQRRSERAARRSRSVASPPLASSPQDGVCREQEEGVQRHLPRRGDAVVLVRGADQVVGIRHVERGRHLRGRRGVLAAVLTVLDALGPTCAQKKQRRARCWRMSGCDERIGLTDGMCMRAA